MNPLMDELTFRSYAHNRMLFPDVQPERWAAIFQNVPAMEERFLKSFIAKLMEAAEEIEVADCATGITSDNGLVGTGVSSSTDGRVDEGQARFAESLSGDNAALTEQAGTQVPPAGSPSLSVPLGREVSGEQRSHCENMVQGVKPFATVPVQFESGYCDGSPADQILEVAPRQEQPAKAVNHESGTGAVANRKPLDKTNCVTSIKNANNLAKGADSTDTDSASEHQGTTIENLVATVERVTLKQRIDFEMRLKSSPRFSVSNSVDPIHDSNGRW